MPLPLATVVREGLEEQEVSSSQSQPCGEASADAEVFAGLDAERAAALGRACEANGLGWYEDGEMRFQPPIDAFRDEIARLEDNLKEARLYWRRETEHAEYAEGQAERYRAALKRIRRLDTFIDKFGLSLGQAGRIAAEALDSDPVAAADTTDPLSRSGKTQDPSPQSLKQEG